uniref:Uncharacterized protein n=1 Tax=Anguilla anguilla TaxID=7936 RepID=A0A0E9XJ09_ANGAN
MGRRAAQLLLRLSFRWWLAIQEMSARQEDILSTCEAEEGKERVACHLHNNDRRSRVH